VEIYDSDFATVRYEPSGPGSGTAYLGCTPRTYFQDKSASASTDVRLEAQGLTSWLTQQPGAVPAGGGGEAEFRDRIASFLAADEDDGDADLDADDRGDADDLVEEKVSEFLRALGLPVPDEDARGTGPRWPADRVLHALQAECGLPDGGRVERVGGQAGLSYRDNGLLRRIVISPQAFTAGRLDWQVIVCAEALQPGGGMWPGMWTVYEPAPGLASPAGGEPRQRFQAYPWPVAGGSLDPELVRDVARFARRMLWFLADARDLGALMLGRDAAAGGWVTRGEVRGQFMGGAAAGVVGAIILARTTGQPELEQTARDLVASAEVRGRDVRSRAQAHREWAPVDISDLEAIEDVPKYSGEEIRREFARYFPQDKPRNR
jgi:hypothetical protein